MSSLITKTRPSPTIFQSRLDRLLLVFFLSKMYRICCKNGHNSTQNAFIVRCTKKTTWSLSVAIQPRLAPRESQSAGSNQSQTTSKITDCPLLQIQPTLNLRYTPGQVHISILNILTPRYIFK